MGAQALHDRSCDPYSPLGALHLLTPLDIYYAILLHITDDVSPIIPCLDARLVVIQSASGARRAALFPIFSPRGAAKVVRGGGQGGQGRPQAALGSAPAAAASRACRVTAGSRSAASHTAL